MKLSSLMMAVALSLAVSTAMADEPAKQRIQTADPFTGTQGKAYCEGQGVDLGVCYGALLSVVTTNAYYSDTSNGEINLICTPKGVTAEQLRKAFLDYAKASPEQMIGPFSMVAYSAITEAYPCISHK